MNGIEKPILIVGIIILIIGMFFVFNAGNEMLHPESNKIYDPEKICTYEDVLCIPYFRKDVPYGFADGVNGTLDLDVQFRTFDTWAVRNEINYTITVIADKPNVFDEIYFLSLQPVENVTRFNGENMRSIIDEYNSTDGLFVLEQKTPIRYVAEGHWFSPVEMDIRVYGILIHDSYGTGIPESQSLITIGSHLQKLQADTNKELLQQIKETKVTNDIILGLTIIVISFVPLGIVLESIVHKSSKSWRDDYKNYS